MVIENIDQFVPYYQNVRRRTRRVIDCIPEGRMEWAHQPGRFTFGDLIRHLASIERFMFLENAQGRPSRYPGHGRELADGHDAVIDYMDRLHEESIELLNGLTGAQLNAKCETPGRASITVWKWLRSMVEHEVHHRGQIYLMLGILGVETPPLYGLTEEEVFARSRQ